MRTRFPHAVAAVALAALMFSVTHIGSGAARAQGVVSEVKLGVLAHDVPGLWSGFQREDTWGILNAEAVFLPSLALFGGQLRPAAGASVNLSGGTSHAYIDARWQVGLPWQMFFAAGLGAAIHDGDLDLAAADSKALGSRVLFHVPVELGIHLDMHNSLSVYFEHMSNGNLARVNEGLDNLGLRYTYRY